MGHCTNIQIYRDRRRFEQSKDIQYTKDAEGYMWFLTNEGMDRYNGKDIKHYRLNKDDNSLESPIHLGWIYTNPHIGTWVIGKQGRVFQYERKYDDFKLVYKLPNSLETISYGYMDRNNNIWLCRKHSILLYNTENAQILQFTNILHSNITAIEQVDDHHFLYQRRLVFDILNWKMVL